MKMDSISPYPPLRRKQKQRQEPRKPYDPSGYDGCEEGQPLEVEG